VNKELRIKIKIDGKYTDVTLAKNEVDKLSHSLQGAGSNADGFYSKLGNTAKVVGWLYLVKKLLSVLLV